VVGVLVVVRQACRVYSVDVLDYARRAIIPTMLPAALQVAVTYGVKVLHPPHGLGLLLLETLPGVALYGLAFWAVSVGPLEKQLLAEKLLRWRSARPKPELVCSEGTP